MELPSSSKRQEYTEEIKIIEATIKDIANGDAPQELYTYTQTKLDKLANRFQHDESLGGARYKLYELQAVLYYFEHEDEKALAFIQEAIRTKGDSYKRAEQLIAQIGESPLPAHRGAQTKKLSRSEKRRQLIGIDGWLALFTVGIGISVVMNIVSLSDYPELFRDLRSIGSDGQEFVDALTPILQYEVLYHVAAIVTAVLLIILLAKHRAVAKPLAVLFMAGSLLLGVIDYVWVESVFSSLHINAQQELNKALGDIARAVIAGSIWIPYFLISKRVKATLTK